MKVRKPKVMRLTRNPKSGKGDINSFCRRVTSSTNQFARRVKA